MRAHRRGAGWLAALVALAIAAGAWGKATRVVLGAASAGEPSHAWMVMTTDGTVRLLHLPPRSGVERPAELGSVRAVRDLRAEPTGLAAVGARVYLLFEPEAKPDSQSESKSKPGRTVLSGRAIESVGGLWAFDPPDLLEANPSLPAGGEVRGFTGTTGGPAALLVDGGRARVVVLQDEAWREYDPPIGVEGDGVRGLLAWEGDPALVAGDGVIWKLNPGDGTWAVVSEAGEGFGAKAVVFGVGAVAVEVRLSGGGATIRTADPSGVQELGLQEGLTGDVAVAPIGPAPGSIAMVWRETGAGGEEGAFHFVERSLTTGAVVYEGAPRQVTPVTAGEFQLLVSVLVVLTIAVLLIAVKPMPGAGPVVPAGTALAEPGRRMAATVFDGMVAVVIVSRLFGVGVFDVLSLQVVFEPHGWVALPTVCVVGAVIGTACEAAFGRTLGKLAMGCRVARARDEGGRPGVGRCALRNGIKWMLPPVAALALLEPAAPHRGDVLSGLVVVVDLVREGSDDGEG